MASVAQPCHLPLTTVSIKEHEYAFRWPGHALLQLNERQWFFGMRKSTGV